MKVSIMIVLLSGLISGAVLSLSGCDSSPETASKNEVSNPSGDSDPVADQAEQGGLSIKLPNVDIKVGDGVKVKAPGTDVNLNEDGIDITAPGVEIKTLPKSED
jgi:hypothetical protein